VERKPYGTAAPLADQVGFADPIVAAPLDG